MGETKDMGDRVNTPYNPDDPDFGKWMDPGFDQVDAGMAQPIGTSPGVENPETGDVTFGGQPTPNFNLDQPAPPPAPEVAAAKEEERKKRGRAATVLTGGRGVLSDLSVARRTLVGS